MVLVERVEGVEKFFLRAVAAGEEVDVVDHEHVDLAIPVTELVHVAVLDGGDELVDEAVAGEVEDAQVGLALQQLLADGLEEVSFS